MVPIRKIPRRIRPALTGVLPDKAKVPETACSRTEWGISYYGITRSALRLKRSDSTAPLCSSRRRTLATPRGCDECRQMQGDREERDLFSPFDGLAGVHQSLRLGGNRVQDTLVGHARAAEYVHTNVLCVHRVRHRQRTSAVVS